MSSLSRSEVLLRPANQHPKHQDLFITCCSDSKDTLPFELHGSLLQVMVRLKYGLTHKSQKGLIRGSPYWSLFDEAGHTQWYIPGFFPRHFPSSQRTIAESAGTKVALKEHNEKLRSTYSLMKKSTPKTFGVFSVFPGGREESPVTECM